LIVTPAATAALSLATAQRERTRSVAATAAKNEKLMRNKLTRIATTGRPIKIICFIYLFSFCFIVVSLSH
jgi:hypothetical protein